MTTEAPKTLDQILAWATAREGWKYFPARHSLVGPQAEYWTRGQGTETEYAHKPPIPATLDAIAALMPEGWWWTKTARWYAGPKSEIAATTPDTGDELFDRALLAYHATIASERNP
jgi:hypothetical protein